MRISIVEKTTSKLRINALTSFRHSLSNVGITPELSPLLASKIRNTNTTFFIFGVISTFYLVLFFCLGLTRLGLCVIPFALTFFSVLVFNKLGLYSLCRVVMVLNCAFVDYFFSTSLGQDSAVHLWFVPALLVPFLLFTLEEKAYLIVSFITTTLTFLFLWISKNQYLPLQIQVINLPENQITFISYFMIIGSFSTSFCIVLFLLSEYEKMLKQKTTVSQIAANYSLALDASSLVSFSDPFGKITYANTKFCDISGRLEEDLVGKNHSIMNSGHHSKEFFGQMWKTIKAKEIWHDEVCNKARDGHLYWVDTTIVPVLNIQGDIEQYIAIRHDITRRKLTEQASINSAKMATLGEMASGIAHEINNPLGIIHGKSMQLLRHLQRGTLSPESGVEELSKIIKNSDRIEKIIKGLRSFSRDSSKDPATTVELKILFSNVLDLCADRFRANGVKLELGPVPELMLLCHEIELEQVLINLLNNAFDAIQSLTEKFIRIEISSFPEQIQISITDSGSGIPADIVNNLMNPFFTTKEVGKGTGLGLSISKGIVEKHGGKLWVDRSSPNTKFVIDLPANPCPVRSQS